MLGAESAAITVLLVLRVIVCLLPEEMGLITPRCLEYGPTKSCVISGTAIQIKGVGWEYLWRQIVPLVGLGLVVFSLAIVRFQKKID